MHLPHLLAPMLALCPLAAADSGGTAVVPYGTARAGAGSTAPRAWVRGNPYLGNATFQLTVDRGVGGAVAVLMLSARPARIPLNPGEFLLDPTAPLFGVWGVTTLSGTTG